MGNSVHFGSISVSAIGVGLEIVLFVILKFQVIA